MRNHKRYLIAAAGLLWAAMTADARAQVNFPLGPESYSHDFQLFAPFQLDLDDEPYQDNHGYMFSWNKLAWSFSGENVTVGNPDAVVFSEIIYYETDNTLGGPPPPPYRIFNGLNDAIPDAGFAWGDRYEIGYRDGANGWEVGILYGLEQNQFQGYGMSPTLQGTSLPGTPPIDPSYVGPVSADQLYALGFGNVHVNFETPEGYLFGFRDYLNYLTDAAIGTQVGPIAYVGNYGAVLEPEGDDEDIDIPFFRLTDDINQNGVPGSIVIIDPVTGLLTTLTDFGDLHQFNIAFDRVEVRSTTKMTGVELMWTHELTNRHYMAKHQNNRFELAAGARFMRLKDFFGFDADGGILGATFSNTTLENNIVGPQVRAKWTNQRARWRLSGTTSFLFGYNTQNWSQQNGIGAELVPGATNRLLYAQPTFSNHGLTLDTFSPVGELRLESSYYLTQSFALKVGYTGQYIGNIRRAATSVRYFLPDMGFRDSGNQELITNGVDAGVEFVY
jgi:hypothetical protein